MWEEWVRRFELEDLYFLEVQGVPVAYADQELEVALEALLSKEA